MESTTPHSGPDQPNSTDRSNAPAFIISGMRCGSTLLRYLLDSHEHLACPPESKFIAALDQFLDYPQVLSALLSLGYSTAEIYAKIRKLIESFLDGYAARQGKRRWIDKTPGYFRILPFLDKVFAGHAIYILLVRHPLDCISSLDQYLVPTLRHEDPEIIRVVESYGKGRIAWAKYWMDVHEKILWFSATCPDRSHVIRYEDLVHAPQEKLAGILQFIGEDPKLLHMEAAFSMSHARGYQDLKILKTTHVHSYSLDQWRTWPKGEAQMLWQMVEPLASKFGYPQPV